MRRSQAVTASIAAPVGRRLPPLRAINIPLALFGMGVAAYLSYVHWRGVPPACGGLGDCETVQTSKYAEVMGTPVAALGLAMYAAIFVLVVASLFLRPALAAWSSLAVFGIALGGVLYSAYLSYLEVAVIHAICIWCVVSAIIVTAILAVTSVALVRDGVIGR